MNIWLRLVNAEMNKPPYPEKQRQFSLQRAADTQMSLEQLGYLEAEYEKWHIVFL